MMMMAKFKKYWYWDNLGDRWVHIYCPIIDDKEATKSLGVKRQIYQQFKELEMFLKESVVFIGWVAATHLEDAHIMRFLAKVGAKPYNIELKVNKLWFCKDFNGG